MMAVQLDSDDSCISMVTASSSGCGFQGIEPPAFVLPPRNVCVSLGGDARLEGKVG
uniref:Uncharacterized protein n=1 Tax=Kryptolebias marmoratus TaxID=37003 RepID=A0A3Q2ZZ77_KRYMA